jgi:hypothetical protein
MVVTKYTKIVSLLDDTYDAYASFEEIQHFSDAIERFVSCYLIIFLLLFYMNIEEIYYAGHLVDGNPAKQRKDTIIAMEIQQNKEMIQ